MEKAKNNLYLIAYTAPNGRVVSERFVAKTELQAVTMWREKYKSAQVEDLLAVSYLWEMPGQD